MIQKARGTKDIYGIDEKIYAFIFKTFEQIAHSYNFHKITTPAFEHYELFKDTTGETSDIISKEIYKFEDFGGRMLALKPEGTAPVGRAIVENKLYTDSKYDKLYYIDSMFRYEKPQKGRLRQFYQIGIELTNNLNNLSILEVILVAKHFLSKLDIKDYVLSINSLGSDQERQNYLNELKAYFLKHKDELSLESQNRIEKNPLRILDDKVDSQKPVVINAPKIEQYWSEQTKKDFEELLSFLKLMSIDYVIDYSLVRGLDYYSNVVFEFISNSSALGTKSTIIGGGCYQDLVSSGSNPINGVGFGCGVERLFEILKANEQVEIDQSIDVFFILENTNQVQEVMPTIYQLREHNISVQYNFEFKKNKKLFNDSLKYNPKLLVFKDIHDLDNDLWTFKHNNNKEKIQVNNLLNEVKKILKR